MYPIDDYPDIFFIYRQMIKENSYFSIANFLNFFNLFEQYACYVKSPNSRFANYFIGGGSYECSNFPLSFTYIYYFLSLSFIFILLIYFFYRLIRRLPLNQFNILKLIILNLILLPSTTFFLLSFHIDVPYHFLAISFVLYSFYLSFKGNHIKIYPIYLILFILIYSAAPDNQGLLFLALYFCSILSLILSRNIFIQNIFTSISWQLKKISNLKFYLSKKFFIYFLLTFSFVLGSIVINRIKILEYLASNEFFSLGGLNLIAKIYINPENVKEYTLLFKYPIYIRLFGALQGLIISTPFGIKPSIILTFSFFIIFIIGFIKLFSLENKSFPIYIKLFLLTSFVMMVLVLSIFPFFSYAKYWVFLIPFAALFMSFSRRLSLVALSILYIELLLKSYWI